jgi:hypothetical protein
LIGLARYFESDFQLYPSQTEELTMTDHDTRRRRRGGAMRIPRTRGALSGFLLIILGIWGALIPFIGPYFKYSYTPDSTWTWTAGRLWLEVVPGVVAIVGGLILLTTANRANAVIGGWLASAAGAWFVVGPVVSRLWGGDAGDAGSPVGGNKRQVIEQLGFFSGLGVVILFLAAHAAGRVTVRSVRDLEAVDRHSDEELSAAHEPNRDERRRDEPLRDETRRDEPRRDEPRRAERETGAATVSGHSGASPIAEGEGRSGSTGGSGSRERR